MSELFGRDYNSFVDNWYTNEKLFRYLQENGTAACGTTRGNWLQLPKAFKKEPLEKGQYRFLRDEDMPVVRFHDKKEICFLSTIHSMEEVASGKSNKDGRLAKMLQLVSDYQNKHMGGFDKNDALVGNYSCVHKSYKKTIKVFFHFT